MSLRTPLGRVRGLGSAKDGVGHWWLQRVTAVALVPLAVILVGMMLHLARADHATVLAYMGHTYVATFTALGLIAAFWHLKLGIQVVVEDYVHTERLKVAALLANTFGCIVFAGLGVVAVLTLAAGV
ncbi:MAG: succinate dehydrogenase, hydrophobic membrane anchor protein [Alphaproteobacteria bacterium]|nr:succinate dehydrogenase, hydrophobic membrane anchor protein [Alphaproteobacteria bacterium]